MSFKTILAAIRDSGEIETVLAYAAMLGEAHKSHLLAVHAEPGPYFYAAPDAIAAAEYYDRLMAEARERTEEIRAKVAEYCRKNGIVCEWRSSVSLAGPSAGITIPSAFAADLVIAGQADPANDDGATAILEQLLFETGRPVLFVPFAGRSWKLPDTVILAWNGTRESARAAFDALPLLITAKSVEILLVDPHTGQDQDAASAGHEIAAALSRHNVKVTVYAAPSGGEPAGDAIASRVAESGANLLVMGAYGRSRWRELIFGGATRSILSAMTAPTLMSH